MFQKNWSSRQLLNQIVGGANLSYLQDRGTLVTDYLIQKGPVPVRNRYFSKKNSYIIIQKLSKIKCWFRKPDHPAVAKNWQMSDYCIGTAQYGRILGL